MSLVNSLNRRLLIHKLANIAVFKNLKLNESFNLGKSDLYTLYEEIEEISVQVSLLMRYVRQSSVCISSLLGLTSTAYCILASDMGSNYIIEEQMNNLNKKQHIAETRQHFVLHPG